MSTPVPYIGAVSPASGTTAGGTLVTITGGSLTGFSSIRFGSVLGTSWTPITGLTGTVVTPAEGAGTVEVDGYITAQSRWTTSGVYYTFAASGPSYYAMVI